MVMFDDGSGRRKMRVKTNGDDDNDGTLSLETAVRMLLDSSCHLSHALLYFCELPIE